MNIGAAHRHCCKTQRMMAFVIAGLTAAIGGAPDGLAKPGHPTMALNWAFSPLQPLSSVAPAWQVVMAV
jgi:hypothetical protein